MTTDGNQTGEETVAGNGKGWKNNRDQIKMKQLQIIYIYRVHTTT